MSYHDYLCTNCGSPAILVFASNANGRHCCNCGAGWYVLLSPQEVLKIEKIDYKKVAEQIIERHEQAARACERYMRRAGLSLKFGHDHEHDIRRSGTVRGASGKSNKKPKPISEEEIPF